MYSLTKEENLNAILDSLLSTTQERPRLSKSLRAKAMISKQTKKKYFRVYIDTTNRQNSKKKINTILDKPYNINNMNDDINNVLREYLQVTELSFENNPHNLKGYEDLDIKLNDLNDGSMEFQFH